jgi:hypothetical protein
MIMLEYRIGAIRLLKELTIDTLRKSIHNSLSKENLQKEERRGEVSIRILIPTNDAIDKTSFLFLQKR